MGIVPIDQRCPMWHFGGLWTTFVAGFWFMVPCFVMYDGGYSLVIAMGTAALGYGLYVAYALAGRADARSAHVGCSAGWVHGWCPYSS
jgi:hypothetical protein